MGVVFQSRDIASVAITTDRTALGECSLGKLFDRDPLDVLHDPHFDIAWVSSLIQGYSHKNLCLFCTTAPFLPNSWPTKVGIVKFNSSMELMCLVPLTHSGADTHKHIPCSFIGCSEHRHQRNGGDTSFVLTDKVERQKPLRKRHVGLVEYRPRCH